MKKQAEGKIDAGAARRELELAVNYGGGQCGDDTEWLVRGILVDEIRRLRQDNYTLKRIATNYLLVQDQEKAQSTHS